MAELGPTEALWEAEGCWSGWERKVGFQECSPGGAQAWLVRLRGSLPASEWGGSGVFVFLEAGGEHRARSALWWSRGKLLLKVLLSLLGAHTSFWGQEETAVL